MSEEPEPTPQDRGIPSINRTRSLQSRMSSVLAIGLMSVLGLGLLTWYYSRAVSRPGQAQRSAQLASQSKAQGEMALPALGRIDPPQAQVAPPDLQVATTESPALDAMLGPPPELPAPATTDVYGSAAPVPLEKTPAQRAFERRLSGPAFTTQPPMPVLDVGLLSQVAPEPTTPTEIAEPTAATDLSPLLAPTTTSAVDARVLPNQNLLLPKGAFIDCTLETAIDSTLPGMATCITATDTFGADGKVVLLERGTKLVGETRGQVQQGSSRVFVVWSEARTPTGVVVPLASPGTDELGRSGLPGKVDRHFLERFGAAILITVIDGAVQAATQPHGEGGTVIYNPSASQDIMTEVLRSTISIPPTVVKHQGDRIQILVARDLNFGSVYELRPVIQ